jgi:hypothetical protein
MEVHAHTHTERKKWTHYLWEFLMLFLAVFCGFLAEYQLEHKIERDRGKEYIRSMIEDLQTDTANLVAVIHQFDRVELRVDTALSYLPAITAGYNDTLWRNLVSGFPDFIKADRTMQQLTNSGGMRMIKNKKACDGIINYDLKYKDLLLDIEALSRITDRYFQCMSDIVDFASLDADRKIMPRNEMQASGKHYLLRADKPSLGKLYNEIRFFKIIAIAVKRREGELKSKAIDLIQVLKKEYKIN